MTELERFRLMSAVQSKKELAGAGLIVIEGTSSQVLRWPSATGPRLYLTLYKLGQTDQSGWSLLHSLERQLVRLGVHVAKMTFSSIIGVYACFVGEGSSGRTEDPEADIHTAIRRAMMEMNQSYNMQYLGLQQRLQDESRRFSLISNIMKTRHDTAKNSISNIR